MNLTRPDQLYAANSLLARAKATTKKLSNARYKELHPVLMKDLQDTVENCTRIALLLLKDEK
jgi:hypothetical protein